MGILLDLFTKMSLHYSLSVFHITQNLFHKGAGKHSSDHVGIYRNSKITILFHNPLDNNPLLTVANRLVRKGSGELCNMLEHIMKKHRYVVIHGGMELPKKLRFMTDLFGSTPEGIIRKRVLSSFLKESQLERERDTKRDKFRVSSDTATLSNHFTSWPMLLLIMLISSPHIPFRWFI